MDTIHDCSVQVEELPRFDNGTINVTEPIRVAVHYLVDEVMDGLGEEARAQGNQRNGYRERKLLTCVGEIALRIPKLRVGSYFPEDLPTRWPRTDKAPCRRGGEDG